MELLQVYNKLLNDNSVAFVQTKDGNFLSLEKYGESISRSSVAIYPGSFNPLHRGHKDIFSLIDKNLNGMFETSITRWGKSELSYEDLEARTRQFVNYAPLVITNLARFIDKAGLFLYSFDSVQFHVGMDTLKRMVNHDYGILGIQGVAADFIVHERMVNGELETLNKFFEEKGMFPKNCISGPHRDMDSLIVSSTAIRNSTNHI